MYTVFFDSFMLLVMGYMGKKALGMKLAYIGAFNAMREQLEGKKPSPRQRRPRTALPEPKQLALPSPKNKFEAYLEEVEAFRARTNSEIRRLLKDGLGLVDIYKFGPEGLTGFLQYLPELAPWRSRLAQPPCGLLLEHGQGDGIFSALPCQGNG